MSNKLSANGWYVVDVGTPFISDDNEFVHFIQAGRFAFDVSTPAEVCEEESAKLANLLSAAPELLEALCMFVHPHQMEYEYTERDRREKALAAITKAKGEI